MARKPSEFFIATVSSDGPEIVAGPYPSRKAGEKWIVEHGSEFIGDGEDSKEFMVLRCIERLNARQIMTPTVELTPPAPPV